MLGVPGQGQQPVGSDQRTDPVRGAVPDLPARRSLRSVALLVLVRFPLLAGHGRFCQTCHRPSRSITIHSLIEGFRVAAGTGVPSIPD